jgi:acetyl-CoA carboxylase biotin carboxyl carrier protein
VDLKQIEKLMDAMEHAGIKRLVLKRENFEIELERESYPGALPPPAYLPPPAPPAAEHIALPAVEKPIPSPEKESTKALYVHSPMVGTFYASPSPEDPHFVKEGDTITEGTVVCIIEAMKVMNEVKAGVRGVVSEILVKNGEPVEFGTQILKVMPTT